MEARFCRRFGFWCKTLDGVLDRRHLKDTDGGGVVLPEGWFVFESNKHRRFTEMNRLIWGGRSANLAHSVEQKKKKNKQWKTCELESDMNLLKRTF